MSATVGDAVWGRLREARAIGLRREEEKDEAAPIIVDQTDEVITGQVRADLAFPREALGLDPDAREFRLSYGLVPDEANEITVLTSSIIEIMNELAWRIDVPPSASRRVERERRSRPRAPGGCR